MLGSMEEEALEILEDISEKHPDSQTRDWCRRVLDSGLVDVRSMHKILGIEGSGGRPEA